MYTVRQGIKSFIMFGFRGESSQYRRQRTSTQFHLAHIAVHKAHEGNMVYRPFCLSSYLSNKLDKDDAVMLCCAATPLFGALCNEESIDESYRQRINRIFLRKLEYSIQILCVAKWMRWRRRRTWAGGCDAWAWAECCVCVCFGFGFGFGFGFECI